MFQSRRSQITDELLSAYLDGAVSLEEKQSIEAAAQTDAEVAWRLETLRQTVSLLRTLPQPALPRSFVLSEADLATYGQPAQTSPILTAAKRVVVERSGSRVIQQHERKGFWQTWVEFWQGGSPFLRNAATAALAVWLVLFGVGIFNPLINVQRANGLPVAVQFSAPQTTTIVTSIPAQQRSAPAEVGQANADEPQAVVEQAAPSEQSLAQPAENAAAPVTLEEPIRQVPVPAVAATDAPLLLSVPANSAPANAAGANAPPQAEGTIGGGSDSAAKAMTGGEAESATQPLASTAIEAATVPEETPIEESMSAASDGPIVVDAATDTEGTSALTETMAAASAGEPDLSADQQSAVAPTALPEPAVPAYFSETTQTVAQPETSPASDVVVESPPPTATLQPVAELPAQTVVTADNNVQAAPTEVAPVIAATLPATIAPTATSAGAAVALVNTEQESIAQPAQANVQGVPVAETIVSREPLVNPWRIQLAQFGMAVLAAVLAAFWLLSHHSQRS